MYIYRIEKRREEKRDIYLLRSVVHRYVWRLDCHRRCHWSLCQAPTHHRPKLGYCIQSSVASISCLSSATFTYLPLLTIAILLQAPTGVLIPTNHTPLSSLLYPLSLPPSLSPSPSPGLALMVVVDVTCMGQQVFAAR